MTDVIMTWLLRLLFWGFQLGVLLVIAWVSTALLTKSRRAAAWMMAGMLVVECCLCGWIAYHPIVNVPKSLESYVSRAELASLSRGFYSWNIPVFPCYVEVVRADEREVLVRTWYCFFGTTEHTITADGYNLEKPLFPSS